MRVEPGDRVDRYVLRARLGEGGQGEVWRAEDPLAPGEDRAVKLVPVASASPSQLERVRREARQLVQLEHPSLVRCHGMFEDLHRELLGIVMEFVDGDALRTLLQSGRLTPQLRFLLLAHVAGALAYVHQRGMIHRDVKLENVLVTNVFWATPEDPATVKLIDFGIAVEANNPKPLTRIGAVVGTPPYFAPEALEPEFWRGSNKGTPTSDVFAWAILAWKVLADDPAAHPTSVLANGSLGAYAAAYRRASQGEWPQTVPDQAWHGVLGQALALEPAKRIADGLALVQAISSVVPGTVLPTAESASPPERVDEDGERTEPVGSTNTADPTVRTVLGDPLQVVFAPTSPTRASRARRNDVPLLVLGLGTAAIALLGIVAIVVATIHMSGASSDASAQASSSMPTRPAPPTSPSSSQGEMAPMPELRELPAGTTPTYTTRHCVPRGDDICTCCPSGHDCLGAACDQGIAPEESFLLRAAGGAIRGRHLHEAVPGGLICVRLRRLDAAPFCMPVDETRPGGVPAKRLAILYKDISTNGIVVELRDATGTTIASTPFTRNYTRAVLCEGMPVKTFGANTGVDSVGFFLDPPTEPAQCCLRRKACESVH